MVETIEKVFIIKIIMGNIKAYEEEAKKVDKDEILEALDKLFSRGFGNSVFDIEIMELK